MPMTSRHPTAWASFGGLTSRDTPTATPATTTSAIATQRPAGPAVAIRCPGSTLAAGLTTLAMPSGNAIVLATIAPGATASAGPSAITTTAATTRPNAATARLPWVDRISTRATASAGQAVAFIATASPRTSPAAAGPGQDGSRPLAAGRSQDRSRPLAATASPRQSRPSTGR